MDIIKFIAKEPSVGVFYVQQNTHTAEPNLINLTSKIMGRSCQVTFHSADLEDSMVMARSMKESGLSITNKIMKTLSII